MKKTSWIVALLCLLAGANMTLAFAPFNIYPLAWFMPALLCACWLFATPRKALWLGWLFGFGWAITGGSWVYVSMHTYGGDSVLVAGLITAVMAAALAFYPGIQGYVFNRFFPKNTHLKVLLAFPALWVVFEWLRAHLFTGVPWMLLGTSQLSTPYAGYAPIGSVYLVSLVVTVISALVVTLFRCNAMRQYFCLLAIILLTLLGLALKQIQWTHPISKPISVALVQGNIPEQTKWDSQTAMQTVQTYVSMTQQHWNAPLIFWPESSVPYLAEQVQPFIDQLNQDAQKHHAAILLGIPVEDVKTQAFYNAAIVVGNGNGQYRKHHLVPFGEYIPLKNWIGNALAFLTIPMTGFSAGPALQPLVDMQNLRVAVFICFETAFPSQVQAQSEDSNFLVAISDDGWFGDSIGPLQHEQIDQMRALETGRYLVRDTNSGVTSIINPEGQVVAKAPMYQQAVLTGTIVPVNGITPWLYFGLFPVWCLLLLMLLLAWLRQSE